MPTLGYSLYSLSKVLVKLTFLLHLRNFLFFFLRELRLSVKDREGFVMEPGDLLDDLLGLLLLPHRQQPAGRLGCEGVEEEREENCENTLSVIISLVRGRIYSGWTPRCEAVSSLG